MTLWRSGPVVPCSVMFPVHKNLGLQVFCKMALFGCYGQCLVPVLLMGQSVAFLDLSWVRPGISKNCVFHTCRVLSLCFPVGEFCDEWCLLSDQMSAPSPLLEPQTVVSGYLHLSLGQESLQSAVGCCWGYLHMPFLWNHLSWTPAKGTLDWAICRRAQEQAA